MPPRPKPRLDAGEAGMGTRVAVRWVWIAWSHSRPGEEGGRSEGQASLSEGWSGEREEHERPEADHEGLHRLASNTEASRQVLCDPRRSGAAPTGPYARPIRMADHDLLGEKEIADRVRWFRSMST